MKFNVTADLDWVSGHLRYGHWKVLSMWGRRRNWTPSSNRAIKHYLDL